MFMVNGGIPWTVLLIPLLFSAAWSDSGKTNTSCSQSGPI